MMPSTWRAMIAFHGLHNYISILLCPHESRSKVRFHPISFVKGKASPVPVPLTKGFGIFFSQRNSSELQSRCLTQNRYTYEKFS